MAKRTLQENINQVINDLNEIKSAIETKGVEVPAGTPTRDYGEKILNIETGVDVSADTVVAAALRAGFTAHEASGAAITGTIQNYEGAIVSGATPGAQAKYEEGYADGQASMPDLSKDTVTPDKLVLGETAHDASGAQITGTLDTDAIRAEGVEAGKKSEYDAFWNDFVNSGRFVALFAGVGWNRNTLKPKSSLHVTGEATNMFYFNSLGGDLVELFESNGYEITFTDISGANGMFNFASFTRLPVIAFTSGIDIYNTFGACTNLITIDGIIIDETNKFTYTFNNCPSLINLTIIGTIGQGGLNLSRSPLSKTSITSVINALSSATTGLTVTFQLDAVKKAFETSKGANDGSTSEEWLALAATKSNWTINLINS